MNPNSREPKNSRAPWLLTLALALASACGGAAGSVKTELPPPDPPTDPVAWLPPSASAVARLDLGAWRRSGLAEYVGEIEQVRGIDLSKVEAAHLAVEPQEGDAFSGVAVLSGPFGPGFLAQGAQGAGMTAERHGDVEVYAHEDTRWFQVYDDLIVGGTQDRLSWLLACESGAPQAQLRESPFFQALAPAVDFDSANAAVLFKDADGSAKRALRETGAPQVSRVTGALADVVRVAARVQIEQGLSIDVYADVDSEPHASELEALLRGYLEQYRGSPVLLLFGLRDLVASITVSREGQRVALGAQLTQAQIDALIGRIGPMLENLMEAPASAVQASEGGAPQEVPGPVPASTSTSSASASQAP